jgi:16S rRNA (adenine(1408)-N(1))-methyltransferase
VIVDLGAGEGAGAVRAARSNPRWLVIAVDADASAMARASRLAARAPRKGGLPNLLFLAGNATELRGLLAGRVDELRVVLPWGSLLRAARTTKPWFVDMIASALSCTGRATIMLSVTSREGAAGLEPLDDHAARELASAYEACGLRVYAVRRATREDVDRLGSSWARRLGVPERREAWLLELEANRGNPATECLV